AMRNSPRLARFLVVGVLNTIFSYGVYAAMLAVGLSYAIANLVALIAGILTGFRAQGSLVFDNPDPRRLGRFVAMWAVIYAINIGIIGMLLGQGLGPYLAGAIALVPVTLLSYLLQR